MDKLTQSDAYYLEQTVLPGLVGFAMPQPTPRQYLTQPALMGRHQPLPAHAGNEAETQAENGP